MNILYSLHDTKAKAEEENQRLMAYFNIPDGVGTEVYSIPEEINGKWGLQIASTGSWKADHIAANVQEIELEFPEEIA